MRNFIANKIIDLGVALATFALRKPLIGDFLQDVAAKIVDFGFRVKGL